MENPNNAPRRTRLGIGWTGRARLAGFGVLALASAATPCAADGRTIVMRQLTNITTGYIETPEMQLELGMDIAFVSTADVLGPGTQTATRQIYLWQENANGTGSLRRVTNGVGCESYDVARPTDMTFSNRPKVIAFVSTCNLDPSVGNSDGNPEIFFYEIDTGVFHQITNTSAPVVNGDPFTSDSGRCLVFRSNGNIDNNTPANPHYSSDFPGPGFENADGSDEVFMYARLEGDSEYPHNGTFTQISNGPPGTVSSKPVIGGYWFARQCQTAAYQSTYDQSQTGLVGQQIFLYKPATSTIELMAAAEIPHGLPPGTYQNPSISQASQFARGPNVVFETDSDLWNNGSIGNDIFNFRVFHPRMTQFTNVGNATAKSPQGSDGGSVIIFHSNGELLDQNHAAKDGSMPPFNSDGNFEIFRLRGRTRVTQVTRTEGCQNTSATMLGDGNRIAFVSSCDVVAGKNPNGRTQIFMYALEKPDAPLLSSGNCTQALGCCFAAKDQQTCYSDLSGRKPKHPRPNCLDRGTCD